MKIEEIISCLPHRYPMLLVDKVLEIIPGTSIKTVKNVSINEQFFCGHFPGKPVMPGVLIIESIAQSAGILAIKTMTNQEKPPIVYFMSIESAKFRKVVQPGDTIIHQVSLLKQRSKVCKFAAESFVDGELVCEAEITAMLDS